MTTNPSIKRLTMPKFGTDNPTPDEVEAVRQKAAIYGWTLEQNTAGVVGGKDAHPFGEPTFTLWDQNAKTIMHL